MSIHQHIKRSSQKAQEPSRSMGQSQGAKVSSGEGSLLGKPSKAKVSKGSMPSDKQAQ